MLILVLCDNDKHFMTWCQQNLNLRVRQQGFVKTPDAAYLSFTPNKSIHNLNGMQFDGCIWLRSKELFPSDVYADIMQRLNK